MMEFEREKEHVGEGWQELILGVHEALTALLGEYYEIHQIKEKFGGLRYYWGAPGADPENVQAAQKLVDAAEAQSFKVCEQCGREGTVQSHRGWLVTLCEEHHQERAVEVEQRYVELRKEMGIPDE